MALETIAHREQGKVIPLDNFLAIDVAVYGLKHRLPLADSIIFATAHSDICRAIILTSNSIGFQSSVHLSFQAAAIAGASHWDRN